jgi:hypothetical protein
MCSEFGLSESLDYYTRASKYTCLNVKCEEKKSCCTEDFNLIFTSLFRGQSELRFLPIISLVESLICVLQLRLCPHLHYETLNWWKNCHKKQDSKPKIQNLLSFSNQFTKSFKNAKLIR